jgi:hypothetical protein
MPALGVAPKQEESSPKMLGSATIEDVEAPRNLIIECDDDAHTATRHEVHHRSEYQIHRWSPLRRKYRMLEHGSVGAPSPTEASFGTIE